MPAIPWRNAVNMIITRPVLPAGVDQARMIVITYSLVITQESDVLCGLPAWKRPTERSRFVTLGRNYTL
jgi:hypothetical protein